MRKTPEYRILIPSVIVSNKHNEKETVWATEVNFPAWGTRKKVLFKKALGNAECGGHWELNLGPLWEQTVIFTAEPFSRLPWKAGERRKGALAAWWGHRGGLRVGLVLLLDWVWSLTAECGGGHLVRNHRRPWMVLGPFLAREQGQRCLTRYEGREHWDCYRLVRAKWRDMAWVYTFLHLL